MRILPKQIELLAVIAVLALPALTLSSSTRSRLTARVSTKRDRMGMGLAMVRSIIARRRACRYQCRGRRRMRTFLVAGLC